MRVLLLLIPLLFLSYCSRGLVFAGGFQGGTYSQIGENLSSLEVYDIKTQNTEGSRANINLIDGQQADLGMCQLDVFNEFFFSNQNRASRVLIAVYYEEVHFIANKKIQKIDQLAGKKVAVGTASSGTSSTARLVIGALEIKNVTYINKPVKEAMQDLLAQKVDAMVIVAGAPINLLNQTSRNNLHLLSLSEKQLSKLTSGPLMYRKARLNRNQYFWLDNTVSTIAVDSVLLANKNLEANVVNNLLSEVFKNQNELARRHNKWKQLDIMRTKRLLSRNREFFHQAIVKSFKGNSE